MKFMNFAMVAVCSLAAVLLTACRKNPPIDLSGVRAYPGEYGMQNKNGNGNNQFPAEPFPPMEMNGASAENWESTNQPVGGADGQGGDAMNFLKDGTRWNEVVYFDFDSSEVNAAERPKLDSLAVLLKENATYGLVIEGHCDERGSDEYNRALSERRALSVVEYLSSLGVDAGRMQTISYGEDRPVVPGAQTDADHQKNRRAEFLYGVRK